MAQPKNRKITSKGQVTLPASWRKKIGTEMVLVIEKDNKLEIIPAEIIAGEEVLFDAIRDSNGKGIPVTDLIFSLKSSLKK